MRLVVPLLIVAMLLFSTCCDASQPSPAQSDAFIQVYSFDVLEAIVDESLIYKVESGQLNEAQAACARGKIKLNDLLPRTRPIVTAIFQDANTLNEATAFFSSSTGKKLKDFGKTTLRGILRAKLRGQQPPASASVPPAFSQQDAEAALQFNNSPAGQQFGRFVREGLPQMRRDDLIEPAIASCVGPKSK
jgi:hypothetical protein